MNRIEKIREMLQTSPDDSFLQHALALESMKAGNDREAKDLLISLLNRDPGYVGSYYQLGKLLERNGEPNPALDWYAKGMIAAKKANDNHAFNELRAAADELEEDL